MKCVLKKIFCQITQELYLRENPITAVPCFTAQLFFNRNKDFIPVLFLTMATYSKTSNGFLHYLTRHCIDVDIYLVGTAGVPKTLQTPPASNRKTSKQNTSIYAGLLGVLRFSDSTNQ